VWLTECTPLIDYYMGEFQETVTRKIPKNTVKHRGGSVGLVTANHRGSGGYLVIVTTLLQYQKTFSETSVDI